MRLRARLRSTGSAWCSDAGTMRSTSSSPPRTQREIADINQRGWESRSDSSDAIQRQTVDGINNVDRYTDPVTGNEVQLDNRYDNAWRANDGTYIQSNDPNLNPQVDLGVEAEQMERNE